MYVLSAVTIGNAEVPAVVYRLKCLMVFIHLFIHLDVELWFEWPQYYAVQVIISWLMTLRHMVSLCHFFVGMCCPCLQGAGITSGWSLN